MSATDAATRIRAMLSSGPLEDAVEGYRVLCDDMHHAERRELELELFGRVTQNHTWADTAKGSEALVYCLELAETRDLSDGDTATFLLVRAVQLTPHDDTLVLEYVRAVADNDYRYTDLSLLEIARGLDDAERATRLATLDTICEYMVMRELTDDPTFEAILRAVFAEAAALGMTRSGWLDAHGWVADAVSYASVPADVYDRFAAA